MSTAPDDAWRDAGLENPDDTTSLVEDALTDDAEAGDAAEAGGRVEEYKPRHARPDLDGEAAEADVVEQSQEVPGLDDPEASGDA
ncbi:hypothetical protein [Isoptericola nanjingensis]|uniref:hypothetical protein n=1 Tax=Isoptericola TaxID=254250 RepID=UPI0035E9D8D9|nr:hypothetical protein [Isoptericola sp. QY 916]